MYLLNNNKWNKTICKILWHALDHFFLIFKQRSFYTFFFCSKQQVIPWQHHLVHQNVTGSIPSQVTYLGCRFNLRFGSVCKATGISVSHLSLSVSLKSIKNIFSGEDRINTATHENKKSWEIKKNLTCSFPNYVSYELVLPSNLLLLQNRLGAELNDIKGLPALFLGGSSPVLGSLCPPPEERCLSMSEIGEKERNYYLFKSYTD